MELVTDERRSGCASFICILSLSQENSSVKTLVRIR